MAVSRTREHLTDALAQRWVDGVLPAPDAARAAEHATDCPDCAALAESYRALSMALDALPGPEVPGDFTAGVLLRVEALDRAASRERRAAAVVLSGIAAALAAALLVGGNGAWVPDAARLAQELGTVTHAFRVGAQVLVPLVAVLRLPIAAVCAMLCVPLLFAVFRLTLSSRTEVT
jgi:anti-sigma factor RsiW